jgi:hypothetical protein
MRKERIKELEMRMGSKIERERGKTRLESKERIGRSNPFLL